MISIKYSSGFMCALREIDNKEIGDEFYNQFGASVYEAVHEVKREFYLMKQLAESSHGLQPRITLDEGHAYAITKFLSFMRGN